MIKIPQQSSFKWSHKNISSTCCGDEILLGRGIQYGSMALSLSFPFRNILKPKSFVGTIHSQLQLFESKYETVV